MPNLTVAGARVHYVHRRPVPASRPPVVFIHGAGGTHQHWLYQVRDLPDAPSYAVDLPGHGGSEGPGRDSVAAYGDWLVAFLDAAGVEKAVLVGHSMGGGIAQDVSLRYPARVAGLGLIATGARLRVMPPILDGLRQEPKATIQLISDSVYGPETPVEVARQGRRQMEATPPEVYLGDFIACDCFDIMRRLNEIAVPTLILCGTQDLMTPLKYSIYLWDHIQGATFQQVEGAGHMVMIERPEAVAQALAGLLEQV